MKRKFCTTLISLHKGFISVPGLAVLAAFCFWQAVVGTSAVKQPPQSAIFEEILTSASHLTWSHDNARSARRYLPEALGPGCAFLDYDNDGWMDIYLVNSGPADFYKPSNQPKNALYKNNGNGTFTDVTDKARVAGGTFGMGVAVGDYNNDAYQDIFITSYGSCILYANNRDGTFTDVTEKACLGAPGWTTSAVWFDYNNDTLLDLFVCTFVEYDRDKYVPCGSERLGWRYCIPRAFKSTRSLLFRNNGDGTFTEASHGTDIEGSMGKALGVVATDINNDGLMDLFVANDTIQNLLYINRGNGEWKEIALEAGVGFGANGYARSGMGVDAGDFDGDGWQDLFVANVDQEMYSLYRNNHDKTFTDVATLHGIAEATLLMSGWGLKFFDYDNDGNTDLMLANGHPDDKVEMFSPRVKYKEPLLLFRNDGRRFRNVSEESGPVFSKCFPARGLATGDFNNDGRLDVLVANNGEAPILLRNNAARENHWIGLKLEGVASNRDAVGAVITWSAGGVKRSRLKTGGGSYLSSHDPREVLGLGKAAKADWVEIKWPAPSNRVERLTNPPLDRYITIVEGKGMVFGTNPSPAQKAR